MDNVTENGQKNGPSWGFNDEIPGQESGKKKHLRDLRY